VTGAALSGRQAGRQAGRFMGCAPLKRGSQCCRLQALSAISSAKTSGARSAGVRGVAPIGFQTLRQLGSKPKPMGSKPIGQTPMAPQEAHLWGPLCRPQLAGSHQAGTPATAWPCVCVRVCVRLCGCMRMCFCVCTHMLCVHTRRCSCCNLGMWRVEC